MPTNTDLLKLFLLNMFFTTLLHVTHDSCKLTYKTLAPQISASEQIVQRMCLTTSADLGAKISSSTIDFCICSSLKDILELTFTTVHDAKVYVCE